MFTFYTKLLPFKVSHTIKALEIAEISPNDYKISENTLMFSESVANRDKELFQFAYKSLTDEFVRELSEAGVSIPLLNHSYLSVDMDADFVEFLKTERMPGEVMVFYEERQSNAYETE